MKFGYFDDDQREYVITQPDTPLPWINYLGSQSYFSLISNTAGGYSFSKMPVCVVLRDIATITSPSILVAGTCF